MSWYVEIELNNVLCVKRCPAMFDHEGFRDYVKVRNYFADLGYTVGRIYNIRY